jgi:hypothetical protein
LLSLSALAGLPFLRAFSYFTWAVAFGSARITLHKRSFKKRQRQGETCLCYTGGAAALFHQVGCWFFLLCLRQDDDCSRPDYLWRFCTLNTAAGGPRPRADAGIVDRAIGQEVFATGSASPHRGTSQQASVAIDACIRDAATAMAGVMRCTKAGRADITANAQVETVSRGSLSWPENERTQNRWHT